MNKPSFIISAPVDTYSGYGARARDIVKSIIELDKYDVKILPQRWGDTPSGFLDSHTNWEFLKPLLIPNLTSKPDIWMQITIPSELQPVLSIPAVHPMLYVPTGWNSLGIVICIHLGF